MKARILCAGLLLMGAVVDAKTMKNQSQTVATQEVEEEEIVETTPQRMRLLPGAQRRAEPRRSPQPQSYTQKQYSSSKSQIISHNGGGVSVNISSPDISETKDKVIVTMQISGFTLDEISARVNKDNTIQISAQSGRTGNKSIINNTYSLPSKVDAKRMTKKVSNGVLTITLPKAK